MTTYLNRCLSMCPALVELMDDGYIGLCRLYEKINPVGTPEYEAEKPEKAPENTYKKISWLSIQEIENTPERNFGVCFPEKVHEQDKILCCIDIDGESGKYKASSIILLKNILIESFEKRGIYPVVIKTKSNGFHLYLWATNIRGTRHGFANYCYPLPSNFEFSNRPEFSEYPELKNLLGKRCKNAVMELYSKNAMVVAPGSIIEGRQYQLTNEGSQRFYDVSVYDGYFEDLIFEILEENYFKFDPDKSNSVHPLPERTDTSDLSEYSIQKMGDMIIDSWPLIDGEKQAATLALGGFLYSRNISQQSIIDLGNYVIDNKPDPNFFKGSDNFERKNGFMAALLHDSVENVEKEKQGLTTLTNRFKGKYDTQEMSKVFWLSANPPFHIFYPSGRETVTYPRIKLDFSRKQIIYDTIKPKLIEDEDKKEEQPKEGDKNNQEKDQPPWIKEDNEKNNIPETREILQPGRVLIRHMISDFAYIDDVSVPTFQSDMDMPVRCNITDKHSSQTYILKNRMDLFRNYHTFKGAHHAQGKNIIELIFVEFQSLDMIPTVEGSSRPGLYFSKDKKSIKRFIQTKEGVIETQPQKPSKEALDNALQLLTEINAVMPWQGSKFGAVIKIGLIQPYSFMLKTFNKWVPGTILHGEAGALKSTVGELVCQMSTPIDINKEQYIVSGSDVHSEFRMGRDFDYNSYPLVMNECLAVLSNQDAIETLKNIVDREFIRSPGGDNPQTYYARSVPFITLNDELDAMSTKEFARRFLSVNLTINDAYTESEINEKLLFLNKDGIQNKRFEELTVIGEYIFYYLNNHIEILTEDIYTQMDLLLEALQSETNVDLSWLDVDLMEYIGIDVDESIDNELENSLKALRRIFLENKRPFSNESEEELLKKMIGREYSYIFMEKNQEGVVITRNFEHEFPKVGAKKMKLLRFAELINNHFDETIEYNETQRIDIIGSTQTHRKRKSGIFIPWDAFIEIMQVQKEDDSKIITEMIK